VSQPSPVFSNAGQWMTHEHFISITLRGEFMVYQTVISAKVVKAENSGKHSGEPREHLLVSRSESTTPPLTWASLPM
jgi:hypothetical protein